MGNIGMLLIPSIVAFVLTWVVEGVMEHLSKINDWWWHEEPGFMLFVMLICCAPVLAWITLLGFLSLFVAITVMSIKGSIKWG